MGCTPSLHVSHTGVVYCRENDDSPSHASGAANHQPPPPQPSSLTHNQHQGPSGVNQHGYTRPGCPPYAWDHPHPPQTDSAYLRLGPMKVVRRQLKVLLVFGREDNVSEAWWSACKRQGYDVVLKRNTEDAIKAFLDHTHDLIIIDARSSKHLSAENVCRSIRAADHSQFTVLVGIVKKNFADRENATVGPMLKNGYNRIVTEVSTVGGVLNDLIQIEYSELSSQSQLRAMQAVFSALDSCKEVVHITDTQHRIQYVNRACENILGYSLEDVAGRNLWELHISDSHKQDIRAFDHRSSVDFKTSLEHQRAGTDHRQPIDHKAGEPRVNLDISEAVNMQMRRGREWEGVVTCRRKSGGAVHLPSKVIPVAPLTRKNEYYIYMSDTHALDRLEFSTVDHFHPRGSIKSLRKGSHDIRSLNSDVIFVYTGPPRYGNPRYGHLFKNKSIPLRRGPV